MVTALLNEQEIHVKERLNYVEVNSFIEQKSHLIFITGEYDVLMESISDVVVFLNSYTDYNMESFEDIYEHYETYMNFVEECIKNGVIDNKQYGKLLVLADKRVEFEKEKLIHRENITVNVDSAIDMLIPKLSKLLDTADEKLEQFDMEKLNKTIGKVTPKSIVNEYLKTGKHKENLVSVIEEKDKQIKELKNKITSVNVKVDKK